MVQIHLLPPKKENIMILTDLSREEAIALLACIANALQTTEDARDFCLWLSDFYKKEVDLIVDLKSDLDLEEGAIFNEEFEEHMFQASLPDSDPRKRD
jgi:hypothetical protein